MDRKVLLVEDDLDLRRMYKTILQKNGYEVSEAGDGQTAVDVALLKKPDAIILDLMLPRQGGMLVLKIFRSLPATKSIPVMIMTALPNVEYKNEAEGLAQGYFLKTQVSPKEIAQKVSAIIG